MTRKQLAEKLGISAVHTEDRRRVYTETLYNSKISNGV